MKRRLGLAFLSRACTGVGLLAEGENGGCYQQAVNVHRGRRDLRLIGDGFADYVECAPVGASALSEMREDPVFDYI